MARSRHLLTEVILGMGSARATRTPLPRSAKGSALGDLTDTHLLAAITHRQVDALAEAYERYGAAVCGLAGRLCSPRTADAITRDVFLGMWEDPPAHRVAGDTLLGALLASSHRRSVVVLRAEAERRPREYSMSAAELEQAVMGPWMTDELRDLLTVLTDDQRMAVSLAYFGGFRIDQVADLLCVSEHQVATEVREGLERLGGRPPPGQSPGRPPSSPLGTPTLGTGRGDRRP